LRSIAPLLTSGLIIGIFCCAHTGAQNTSLVPLDDSEATAPLLPAGITRSIPEVFGAYAYLWMFEDGTQVVQYHGEFTLHLKDRRLQSQDAVLWMRQCKWQGQKYYHYEVYLSQHARVRDAAGTVTSGPMLFVTFNTTEPAVLEADISTHESSRDTSLYEEGARIRQVVVTRTRTALGPDGLEIVDLAESRLPTLPEARPVVRYRADEEIIDERQSIVTAIGHVYVSQGLVDSADFLEIQADSAVLFLRRQAEAQEPEGPEGSISESAPFPTEQVDDSAADERIGVSGIGGLGEGLGTEVAGVYLRGDVVLSRGERMIRAPELYYDFENDRALILDAVMRAMAPGRDLPIYVRAAQVRQLSTTEYQASGAKISTSEFYTPHVHLGADLVHLTDVTSRDESGQVIGVQAGKFRMHDVTMNLEGLPVAYWPFVTGDFRRGETAIRRLRTSYSDDDGATFESKWYLFNLLGLEDPEGVDTTLRLDYYSKRGPGTGLDVDYERENAFGLFRGYYIHDTGEDSLGPFRDPEPDTENRGRITWRHRELLGRGWELTLEGSYLSDPTFLEEYFNSEWEEGKEQETLAYLKKQQDNWAFTSLLQWRMNDFLTQTEHFPDLGFHWIGEPLAGIANYYNESHLGFARYRPDNRRLFDTNRWLDNTSKSDITFRGDTRNEVDFPIRAGNVNIVPYATGRSGYWDGSADGGSRNRMFGSVGVRAGTQFWRLFEDVSSDLLDLNGVRHIIRPEVTTWASATNADSIELHPFDYGIETIDDFYGTSLAFRQRWQTKRGGPGRWQVVDWIVFDVELNLFGNEPDNDLSSGGLPIGRFYDSRPENSSARSHIRSDFLYRISDTTTILSDSNFDLNDGNMDLFNLSYAVERTPRLSYFVGYRRIGDTDSNLLGAGANYVINEKHRLAVRAYYDVERSQTEQFDITLIRKFPRWYAALTFAVDEIDEDISVGLSLWPEGAPQAAIGNRRFTRLAESTGIRPED